MEKTRDSRIYRLIAGSVLSGWRNLKTISDWAGDAPYPAVDCLQNLIGPLVSYI